MYIVSVYASVKDSVGTPYLPLSQRKAYCLKIGKISTVRSWESDLWILKAFIGRLFFCSERLGVRANCGDFRWTPAFACPWGIFISVVGGAVLLQPLRRFQWASLNLLDRAFALVTKLRLLVAFFDNREPNRTCIDKFLRYYKVEVFFCFIVIKRGTSRSLLMSATNFRSFATCSKETYYAYLGVKF